MLWPHRIRVSYTRPYDPPRENELGNEIFETVDQTVPGQVVPIGGDNVVNSNAVYVETRYQIMLAPALDMPLSSTAVQYEWQGQQLNAEGPAQRHMLGGRLHHYEAVSTILT